MDARVRSGLPNRTAIRETRQETWGLGNEQRSQRGCQVGPRMGEGGFLEEAVITTFARISWCPHCLNDGTRTVPYFVAGCRTSHSHPTCCTARAGPWHAATGQSCRQLVAVSRPLPVEPGCEVRATMVQANLQIREAERRVPLPRAPTPSPWLLEAHTHDKARYFCPADYQDAWDRTIGWDLRRARPPAGSSKEPVTAPTASSQLHDARAGAPTQ